MNRNKYGMERWLRKEHMERGCKEKLGGGMITIKRGGGAPPLPLWARGDLNSGPFDYQSNAQTRLSYGPLIRK